METRYVSVTQLAERYAVTPRTIWRWSHAGVLPQPVKLTESCTRWDMDEVQEREVRRAEARGAA